MKKKSAHTKSKRTDALVLAGLYLLAMVYAQIGGGYAIGKALYVGAALTLPPTIYLIVREQKNLKKILLGTLTFGFIFGFALSYFAESTSTWTVPNNVFSFRLLDNNTLEEVLGHGMMAILIFTFYEHFLDTERVRKLHKRHLTPIIVGIIGALIVIIAYKYFPNSIQSLSYPYLYIGILAILPLIITIIRYPRLIPKLATLSIYFFIIYFSIEIFAVKYDYWLYPGENYIGWVEFFGLRYPLEELLFWMMLYAPTIVTYYEFTIDDER